MRCPLKLPHFIIGGAARAGSTWLHHALELHPQIYMAQPWQPEPKFFYVDEFYEQGLGYYSQRWFSDTGPASVFGEKSVAYLVSEKSCRRIHADLPDVKLIFILRDPKERAFSNYIWSKQHGFESEDFLTALKFEAKREKELAHELRYTQPFAYISRSLYGNFLDLYFSLFKREQMLFIKFEDFFAAPNVGIMKIYDFLGLKCTADCLPKSMHINAADASGKVPMPEEAREYLNEVFADSNNRLTRLLGPKFTW